MASSASTSPQQLDEPTGSSEYARAAEECAFQKRSRRRRRWTCGFGSILVCLLVIGAVAYRAGQQALRNLQGYIAPTLQQMLHREVRIDSARVSGNRLIIEGLAIADGPTLRSGTLLRARQAVITVSIWDALTRRSTPLAALGSLRIESPELTLVRRASGEWNISDLFRHGNGNLKDFHGRVEMVSGRVTISDYASSTQASPAVEDLHGISLTLDAARSPRFAVAFSADGGGSYLRRLALSGWGHMDGTAYDLRAEVGGADLPYWQHYYHIATKLPARSGEVSLQLTATKQAGHAMHLSGVATSPHLVMAPNVLRGTLVATPLVVRVNDDRFEIDARGQAAGIPITVTGTVIDHPTGSVMDLKVNAPRVLAAQAQRAISGWPELPGVTWDAPFSLDGRISGPARTWRVDVSALAPALRAQGVPVTDVHLNGSYDYNTNRIVIGRAQAQVAGGSIEARGSVDRSQHPAQLAISGKAAGIDLAALPFLPDVEKHGTASADFRAQGPLDHVGATVSLATSDVTLAQARFGRIGAVLSLRPGASPVVRVDASGMRFADGRTAMPLPDRAAAALELLPGRVRIANASLSVDGQPVRVSGSAGFDGSLDVQLSAGHVPVALLGELAGVYGAAGSAVLDAHVTGTTSRPRAAGRITVAQGRYQKNTLDRLTASFEGDPTHEGTVQFDLSGLRAGALAVSKASGQVAMHSGDFILSKVVAETSRGHLLAEGKIARDGALDVAVNASGLDLASLARAAGLDTAGQDPVTGTATFSGRVTGRRQSPAAAGTFVARQGTVHGIPFDDLRGSVHASPAGVTLDQVALRRGGSLLALTGKIDAQHAKAMVIDAQVHAQSVDLAEIARTSALKEPIAGRANADLTVKGTLPNVAVAGHFDVDGAQAVGSTLGHVSGDLTSSGDRTEIRKLTAVDGGAQIALSGTYGPAGRLDLRVEGTQVPLERLDHFTGAYAQMAGRADVNGSVSGSTAHPEVHLNLQTGPVTLAGQSFGALAGQVEYADDEVRVTGLNLSHDGGQ